MAKKGIMKDSYHVDRKKEWLGYIPGNLQVLTNTQNVRKYLSWQYDERGKPTRFRFHTSATTDNDDYPF